MLKSWFDPFPPIVEREVLDRPRRPIKYRNWRKWNWYRVYCAAFWLACLALVVWSLAWSSWH